MDTKTPHHGIYANKLTQNLVIVNQKCIKYMQEGMYLSDTPYNKEKLCFFLDEST